MKNRRDFLRDLGVGASALPFLCNLPSLAAAGEMPRKQRLVIIFSPNGVVPKNFWPDEEGEKFTLKESLTPLADYQDRLLFLKGLSNKVRGDGDGHMRGIGCLLTGIELFPGSIQGGSDTPAGWASGRSIDQEIRQFLQANPQTRTRFGSLEFGALVPERADTWTRMVYAGSNQPVAPIDDPYQMFKKLYGSRQDEAMLKSVLDDLQADLKKVQSAVSAEDRRLIDQHAGFVREMEQQLQAAENEPRMHAVPALEEGIREENDNLPRISRMQLDLMVSSFAADFTRIATMQYTNSVGNARMKWIDVDESHHELSHKPDSDEDAQNKLTRINKWFCEEIAYLVKKLAETPEPGGEGTLLDNTTVVWTNELGKGNSHTHDDIPFLLVGGGLGFKMGRSLRYGKESHHRLLIALAQAFGHEIETFGNPKFCSGGALTGLV